MFSILRILQLLITLEPLDLFRWGFQAKCTSPNELFNQIENRKCHVFEFRLISQDRITIMMNQIWFKQEESLKKTIIWEALNIWNISRLVKIRNVYFVFRKYIGILMRIVKILCLWCMLILPQIISPQCMIFRGKVIRITNKKLLLEFWEEKVTRGVYEGRVFIGGIMVRSMVTTIILDKPVYCSMFKKCFI